MTQVTGPIVINDGAATPVARSFSPEKVTPADSSFAERSSGISAGYTRLKIGLDLANSKRPTNHVPIEVVMPTLNTVNGVSVVAYTARFQGKFILPDVMTAAERANIVAFVANALDNALIRSTVKDLDPLY